jgi:hypothetical protein
LRAGLFTVEKTKKIRLLISGRSFATLSAIYDSAIQPLVLSLKLNLLSLAKFDAAHVKPK